MTGTPPVEVLIRSTDAISDSWLAVTWLDNPGEDTYVRIPGEVVTQIQTRLAAALMAPQPGESELGAAARALTKGPFATRDAERDLSTYLARHVLPETFWNQLAAHADQPVLLRVTPSRRLAQVPWELLTLPDGTRLIEHATLVYEIASTVHYQRDPLPTPWPDLVGHPTLATIDPAVHALTKSFQPTLDGDERNHLIAGLGATDHGMKLDRVALSQLLRGGPESRQVRPRIWLYFGHVSLRKDQPGSASLHMYDGTDRKHGSRPFAGTAELIDNVHRPLTALDLVLGTINQTVRQPDLRYVDDDTLPGHAIWPMPPRVALIACESGGDHASSEAFGLVTAALGNGAEYVTATRWTMPTSAAFAQHHPTHASPYPTSDLAITLHQALSTSDPILEIRDWQLRQLHAWQDTGDTTHTPLLFAGIATHHAPPRRPDGSRF